MRGSNVLRSLLVWITTLPAVLLTALFLFWGVHSLLYPFVGGQGPLANALASGALILTAVLLVVALFRPATGGVALCLWAVVFGWMLYSFRLSTLGAAYRSLPWGTALHSLTLWLVAAMLFLGMLFILRGRLSRRQST